ncbi:DUF2946 domain-containing protein [Ideonella livida]|uniref:DUF2946 domain-containing protein n=1 Tax=Ideonella livida TaxID=2707176 RepID=A0A7C9PHK4_9BURK|nr:DUF2946 domain-containing protein [Ideonella livida]NDY91928.1 DUF2946 domain-containing protein [Ideonella livida]
MSSLRRYLQRLSWIAWWAIFGLAVAPTLSHALAHQLAGQGRLVEVCTPQGMKVVLLDEAGQAVPGTAATLNHLEHCPLCGLSAQAAPPAAPVAVPALLAPARWVPPLFLQAPRPLFTWAPAQPRAPPAGA